MKLIDAAKNLGISFTGAHRAQSDSFIAGLAFVMDLLNYEITNIDHEIIDSLNTQAKARRVGVEKFNPKNMEINGEGDEVWLTGFTRT